MVLSPEISFIHTSTLKAITVVLKNLKKTITTILEKDDESVKTKRKKEAITTILEKDEESMKTKEIMMQEYHNLIVEFNGNLIGDYSR